MTLQWAPKRSVLAPSHLICPANNSEEGWTFSLNVVYCQSEYGTFKGTSVGFLIVNVQTLPLQTYWKISQNYRQSKSETLLVVTGWLTRDTFCSLYGFYYTILQHIHVSAAVIHLHAGKRAMGEREEMCQKECLNMNHR